MNTETEISFRIFLTLEIPEQPDVDEGAKPQFMIDAPWGEHYFDAYETLKGGLGTEALSSHENADVIAEWLEHWAARLREEFPAK